MKQTPDRWAACSHTGPRKDNQDAVYAGSVESASGVRVVVLCVADGVGGAAHGADASRRAARSVAEFVQEQEFDRLDEVRERIPAWLNRMNGEIRSLGAEGEAVGTTLTACLLTETESLLVHVGDTRLYVVDAGGGRCRLLTKDHSLIEDFLRGGGDERDADALPRNVLSQSLGTDAEHVRFDCESGFFDPKRPCWVVIASDGVHGRVGSAALMELCGRSSTPGELAHALVGAALAAQTRDNASVAAYRAGPWRPPKIRRARRLNALPVLAVLLSLAVAALSALVAYVLRVHGTPAGADDTVRVGQKAWLPDSVSLPERIRVLVPAGENALKKVNEAIDRELRQAAHRLMDAAAAEEYIKGIKGAVTELTELELEGLARRGMGGHDIPGNESVELFLLGVTPASLRPERIEWARIKSRDAGNQEDGKRGVSSADAKPPAMPEPDGGGRPGSSDTNITPVVSGAAAEADGASGAADGG